MDKFLRLALETSATEVGELLGQAMEIIHKGSRFIRREEYLDERRRKMVLTTLAVSGDRQGNSYLVTGLREAITLGGSLILLPLEEMENRLKKGGFDGEAADAFGEVANIIAGAFTTIALKALPQKIHFKKTEVAPLSASSLDEPPLPDVDFYLCSSKLTFQDEPLGELDILLPAALFELEVPASAAAPAVAKPGEAPATSETAPSRAAPRSVTAAESERSAAAITGATEEASPVVLIVAGVGEDAGMAASLAAQGLTAVCLGPQDNLREELREKRVAVAILVMREVGELGFAASIKIKSAVGERVPLITAGPAWTRSTVLQAVRYGACDILITPPTPEEVLEKVRRHLPAHSSAA